MLANSIDSQILKNSVTLVNSGELTKPLESELQKGIPKMRMPNALGFTEA